MKAITPVIALVMLLLITTGMVGISYTWFSGMLSANTEKTVIVPAGGIYCSKNRINVVVQNAGTSSNIMDDDVIFADINGVNAKNSLFFGDFDRSGLVGYWRFEDGAKDSSGYSNDGTVSGATSSAGRFGSAYNFDGVDDYVNIPDSNSLDLSHTGTIGFWAKVDAWQSSYALLLNKGTAASSGWCTNSLNPFNIFNHYASNFIAFSMCSGTPGVSNYVSISPRPSVGIWHFYTFTWDGTGLTSYLDGSYKSSSAQTLDMKIDASPVRIGNNGGALPIPFSGAIDEVSIWNRALSADEIGQLSKTGSGKFTLGPGQGKVVMSDYPVFQPGKYTVRIGTRTNVVETAADCL